MKEGFGRVKRRIRWIINSIFLFVGGIVAVGSVFYVRWQMQAQAPDPLAGIEVFCEGEEISALFPAEDSLWVGGRNGVKKLDPVTGAFLGYVAEDLELVYAAEIIQTSDRAVWVGHNLGVTRFAADGSREDFCAPVLTGGRVNALLCAGEQLWVGTMEGANLLERQDGVWRVVQKYTRENGLLSDTVNVLADCYGEIWFGSYLDNRPGGISILSDSQWHYLTVKDGLVHSYINAILPLGDKVLVAVGQLTAGGLNQVEREEDKVLVTDTYGTLDGIPGAKVRWLYLDSRGYLWITTESDGLLITRAEGLSHPMEGVVLTWKQGLADNEVKRIVETEDFYFLAGRYGLTRIEKQVVMAMMEGGDGRQDKR